MCMWCTLHDMQSPSPLGAYMRRHALSDAAFARLVDLAASTTINRLRRGLTEASVDLALQIERVTGGEVSAASLCTDVAKVRDACRAAPICQDDLLAHSMPPCADGVEDGAPMRAGHRESAVAVPPGTGQAA